MGDSGPEIATVGITIVGPPAREDSHAAALRSENSIATIQRSVELGSNFIDTSAEYDFGKSEEVVGRALKSFRREEIVLATKGGRVQGADGITCADQRPESIFRQIDASLRRLDTDWIDIYQLHGPDLETGTPVEESWAAMVKLKQQGKARYIGVCDFDVEMLARCESIHHIDSSQSPYNLVRRQAEADMFPWCVRHGVGIIVYSPMHLGLLSGSFDFSALSKEDGRRRSSWFSEPELSKNLTLVERLRPVAARHGKTVGQLAIAWTLANPGVDVAIVGARSPEQIRQTAPAADLRLSPDDMAQIDLILRGEVAVGGPAPEKM